jgi:nitrate/nitrite transporter NarK
LLGPRGGAVSDRFDLRRLLTATQSLYAVLAALLWALASRGSASVALTVTINLAGVLIATAGTTSCFAVNAVSYAAVFAALIALHPLPSAASRSRVAGAPRRCWRWSDRVADPRVYPVVFHW